MSHWDHEKVRINNWSNPFKIDQNGFGKINITTINQIPPKKVETKISLDFNNYSILQQQLTQDCLDLAEIRNACLHYDNSLTTLDDNLYYTQISRVKSPVYYDDYQDEGVEDNTDLIYIYYGVQAAIHKT
jgi:hypothetical protein